MLSVAAALVQVASTPGAPAPPSWQWVTSPGAGDPNLQPVGSSFAATGAGAGTIFHIGTLFGQGYPSPPNYAPTPDATNCDLDNSGKVDRTIPDELACADACSANVECSEYSNYLSQNQFNLVAQTVTWQAGDQWNPPGVGGTTPAPTVGTTVGVQGDGSTDPTFDPVLNKGQSLGSFSGALYYFSGGAQYTIQARCEDDIVPLGQPPIPSNTACVHARTILDTSEGSN
jgi:hypothetical protein